MNLIKVSIDRPIAVVSAVIMVLLFGWLALKTIPIQLAPDVNRPVITINTTWPGAAPAEIEREIGMDEIRRQLHNEAVLEDIKRIEDEVRATGEEVGNIDRQHTDAAAPPDPVPGPPEAEPDPSVSEGSGPKGSEP